MPPNINRQNNTMTIAITENSKQRLAITISGRLRKAEFDRLQAETAQNIAQTGPARILVLAENFAGWELNEGWGDLSFMVEHDADIGKIAVVAEERWRDDWLMFLGAGARRAEVAFFTPAMRDLASAWLAEGSETVRSF